MTDKEMLGIVENLKKSAGETQKVMMIPEPVKRLLWESAFLLDELVEREVRRNAESQ